MWTQDTYFLSNLRNLLWKPKKGILYKNKSSHRYSHGNAGYSLSKDTIVSFIDRKGKARKCSFRIGHDNKVSIKIGKKIKYLPRSVLKFNKTITGEHYWGQGGGKNVTFNYKVTLK